MLTTYAPARRQDELKVGTRKKVENLSFEDFLEALVRVATMKEFPTEEEIAVEGVGDAGSFVVKLKHQKRFDDFLATHSREWMDPLHQARTTLDATFTPCTPLTADKSEAVACSRTPSVRHPHEPKSRLRTADRAVRGAPGVGHLLVGP